MNPNYSYYEAVVSHVYDDCAYVTKLELKTKCHIYKRVLLHRHPWLRPEPGDEVTLEVSGSGYQIYSYRNQPTALNSYNEFHTIAM